MIYFEGRHTFIELAHEQATTDEVIEMLKEILTGKIKYVNISASSKKKATVEFESKEMAASNEELPKETMKDGAPKITII